MIARPPSPSAAVTERRQWWLPSLSQFIWLVFFLTIVLTEWRLVLISADGDACLHWRIGDWMIQHRAVIRFDMFSHTRPDAPLISKEWLSEILFAALGNAFGWNGVVLLSAALIATTLWLLHRQLLAEGNEPLLSTVLTLAAALACSVHWLGRPHLFTHLLAVIFAWQLRWFDRDRLDARTLFLRLVPLMLLWVNLHGAFFTGLVIIGAFLIGNAFAGNWQKVRTLAILVGVCLLVTIINPNGWKLPAHVMEFFRDPTLARYTNEFRSPNFHTPGARGLLLEFAVIAGTLIVLRPKLSATDIVVIGAWGCLALFATRNVPLFALMVTPILAAHWQAALQDARPGRVLDRYRRLSVNLAGLNRVADGRIIVTLAVLVALALIAKPRILGGAPIVTTDVLTNRFPVAATEFVKSHPDAVTGEMFNDYGWGGYLMLALPERKVFIDGRNDFYGAEFVKEFRKADDAQPGWENILEKHNVGWTILPRTHALNTLLALHNDWSLVFTDEVAAVYGRREGLP